MADKKMNDTNGQEERVAGKRHLQMFTIGIIAIAVTIIVAIVSNTIAIHLSSNRETPTSPVVRQYFPSNAPSEPIPITGTVRMVGILAIETLDEYLNGTISITSAIGRFEEFLYMVTSFSGGEDGDDYMKTGLAVILLHMQSSSIIGEPTIEEVEVIRDGRNLLAELVNTSVRVE